MCQCLHWPSWRGAGEEDGEQCGQVVFCSEGGSGPYGAGGLSAHAAAGPGLWSRYCVL